MFKKVTGNGKCNYFNDDFSFEHYYSSSNDLSFINDSNKDKVLNFISSIGVVPKVKNGYYYPNSNQSYSVHNSLLKEASIRGVNIVYDCKVLNIVKKNGDGYLFGKSLGHKIVPVIPSLVGLVSNDKFIKSLSGVRCDACVSIGSRNEIGEVQFTDYGLSGICIFNLSNIAGRLGNCSVKINFLYNFVSDFDSFCKLFDSVNNNVLGRSIGELLEGYLNYNIVNVILKKCGIDFSCSWSDLGNKKKLLFDNLVSFNVDIVGTRGFDVAQVSMGGISLDDIDINTFESKIVSGLYFTGEVMDVTGDCGGYNLGFAFLSGMIAGGSVGDLSD